ncbi:MAG: helix-hairpin-helix domain-containing protein [gamma proteobacterium symbiont of Bathyaustriella thionipta]|nr:helix-hairpin-helix domain-containing protein [gamma proteobacterium symbiont of Bathyaustriella thionipta]
MKKIQGLVLALTLAFCSMGVFANPVNINTASADELSQAISGVGISKAEAIVAYRQTHGNFNSVDELASVKGIGQKTLDKNRDRLTIKP